MSESATLVREAAADLVERIERAPAAVVVRGPAGIGKTTLCQQALSTLSGRDFTTATANARRPEREAGSSVLTVTGACAGLVGKAYQRGTPEDRSRIDSRVDHALNVLAAVGGVGAVLFPPLSIASALSMIPSARALLKARGAHRTQPHGGDASAVEAVVDLVAEHAPGVIHIGDAQWLSDQSLLALDRLVEAFDARALDLTFVVEIRGRRSAVEDLSPAESVLADLSRVHRVEWLDVTPWSAEEVRALIDRRFSPNSFGSDFSMRTHNVSGGNPMVIDLFIGSAMTQGAIHLSEGVWSLRDDRMFKLSLEVPAAAAQLDFLRLRWRTLSAVEQELVKVVALSPSPLSLDAAAAVCEISKRHASSAWSAALTKGLLRETDGRDAEVGHDLWRSFLESILSKPESALIHEALASNYEVGERERSHHLLLAGDVESALSEAEFALELARESGDLHEADLALNVIEDASGGTLPERFVTDRVRQLRRSGEPKRALVLAEERSAEVPVELRADLIHLSGQYERAHALLRDAIDQGGLPIHDLWRMELRAAHHMKFVDPSRAETELQAAMHTTHVPTDLKALSEYTVHGSLRSMFDVDGLGRALEGVLEIALQSSDRDTAAKVCRKLGEYHMFVSRDDTLAQAVWRDGLEHARAIRSRQRHYLDVVAFWPHVVDDDIEAIRDFYLGRRQVFRDLGIPGWEGHCELLLGEAMRLRGLADEAAAAADRAQEIYVEINMAWGMIAAEFTRAFAEGSPTYAVVCRAMELGLSPLAASRSELPLPLLLP